MEIHDGYWIVEWDDMGKTYRGVVMVDTDWANGRTVFRAPSQYGPMKLDVFEKMGNRFIRPVELWPPEDKAKVFRAARGLGRRQRNLQQ